MEKIVNIGNLMFKLLNQIAAFVGLGFIFTAMFNKD